MTLTPDQINALVILILSVLSVTLGNSVVLFANGVSRNQFIRSLLAFTFLFIVSIFLWTLSIQVFAYFIFGRHKPLADVWVLTATSFIPFIFGFLILLPHLGYYIYALLRVWVMVNLVLTVMSVYQFNILQSLIVSLAGWLLLEFVSGLSFLRLADVKRWFLKLTTGKGEYRDPDDLVLEYVRIQRQLALQAATATDKSREARDG